MLLSHQNGMRHYSLLRILISLDLALWFFPLDEVFRNNMYFNNLLYSLVNHDMRREPFSQLWRFFFCGDYSTWPVKTACVCACMSDLSHSFNFWILTFNFWILEVFSPCDLYILKSYMWQNNWTYGREKLKLEFILWWIKVIHVC